MHPAERPLQKAEVAINTFRASSSLDAAEDAWIDFLHFWVRAINKYDAEGHLSDPRWVRLSKQLRGDSCLTYLWEARNSDEHSIAPVTGRTPGVARVEFLANELGGGVVIGRSGEPGINVGDGLSIIFSPGSLHLVPIKGRQATYDPPLLEGQILSPLELMEHGFKVLRHIIPSE